MKSIKVNADAKILEGYCKDQIGRVVGCDSISNEVFIRIDCNTTIITISENVEQ